MTHLELSAENDSCCSSYSCSCLGAWFDHLLNLVRIFFASLSFLQGKKSVFAVKQHAYRVSLWRDPFSQAILRSELQVTVLCKPSSLEKQNQQNVDIKGNLLDWFTRQGVGSPNNGCLNTGEAENPVAAPSTKLDVSAVLNWRGRPWSSLEGQQAGVCYQLRVTATARTAGRCQLCWLQVFFL